MDAQVLKVVGAVAGIGGIALALFFWLFRDIIRKNIFPRLTKDQAYKTIRLLMILATVVALAGIASWAFAGPQERSGDDKRAERVLTLQLTKLGFETLTPGGVVEGSDIAGGTGASVSDAALDKAADQLAAWLTRRKVLSEHASIQVTIKPGNATRPPQIDTSPHVAWRAYTVTVGPSGKEVRELVVSSSGVGDPTSWTRPDGTWSLMVDPDGHRVVSMPGDATAPVTRDSPRVGVGIAFEDRDGSPELVSDRFAQRFATDPRFHIVDGRSIHVVRELIRTTTPDNTTQISLREQFGFEYVVSCSVRVK